MGSKTGKGGEKSRLNWNVNCCIRFDCKNVVLKCKTCRLYSNYESGEKNEKV